MHPFTHIDATSVAEAIPLLDATSRPLAGGTDMLPLMKEGIVTPERLVNLKRTDDLRHVHIRTEDSGLLIGALTTLAELSENASVRSGYTALAQAAGEAASPQLRNMATLGGNLLQQVRCWYYRGDFQCWLKGGDICHARDGQNEYHAIFDQSPCVAVYPSDPPAALLALDASLGIVGPQGARSVKLADFLQPPDEARHVMHTLAPDELIVAIELPATRSRSVYLKAMDRAVWAYALASVAVAAELTDGVARNVRIVLGGVANVPVRATEAEALVEGRALDEPLLRQAGEVAIAGAQPLAHNRYKLPLVRNLVAQALRDIQS
jgi:xanthine dehydrogenase YagS FAD-binding subunit